MVMVLVRGIVCECTAWTRCIWVKRTTKRGASLRAARIFPLFRAVHWGGKKGKISNIDAE
jgi:hypothetical protein